MRRETWIPGLWMIGVAVALFASGRAAAGPATGNDFWAEPVLFPVVQKARLVCVADPNQECDIDPESLKSDPT